MNIHYGKRDILGATRIATLTIDQGRVERAADIVYITYSLEGGGKNSRWVHRVGREIMVPVCKCDNGSF